MPSHIRPLRSDGTCPSGFRKQGNVCVKKGKTLKQERRPGETKKECMDRKIPILISEGFPPAQATAVAASLCELNKEDPAYKAQHGKKPVKKQDTPERGLDREEGRKRLEERSKRFGIEITDDAKLSFPGDGPTDLKLYADPVNLKFPINNLGRANNARARFKQVANTTYSKPKSRNIVHERIVRQQLKLGASPSINMDDPLDRALPKSIRDQIAELSKDIQKSFWGGLFR